jgi:uncharacterized protein (DUF433 family)
MKLRPDQCPDCYKPYDGVACICQAPWLFKTFTAAEAFDSAMIEDDAIKSGALSGLEAERKFYGLNPQEQLPSDLARERDARSPARNLGKPFLVLSGVGTAAIYSRAKAGESTNQLARDYGIPASEVLAAIEFETARISKGCKLQ